MGNFIEKRKKKLNLKMFYLVFIVANCSATTTENSLAVFNYSTPLLLGLIATKSIATID